MTRRSLLTCLAALVLTVAASACASAPGAEGLRDSFAAQLEANTFVSKFERSGDNMTFTAPRPDGAPAVWRVHIDSATVDAQDNSRQPYKGTVKSSWFVDGQKVEITGSESNLPLELLSNGLSQDCWAFWEADARRWSWE